MQSDHKVDVDVLIIGAGPTGLSAANEALRHGLSVRIFDRKPHRSTYSKALVAHARTLEAFEAMGVIEPILAAGVPFSALRAKPGESADVIRIDLMGLPWGDTRYPYWLSIPQYETERCLEEHLSAQGVEVDWETSFGSFTEHDNHIEATVSTPEGEEKTYTAHWLVGCDGGRSPVREQANIPFERENLGETFLIADVLGDAPVPEDEGATSLTNDGVIFLVPMPEPKRWRIIAHMPEHKEGETFNIDEAFVNQLLKKRLGIDFGAHKISWTSQFVLQQGIAKTYRKGRVFIAGDAAHLHSPVGGQGLNTGVQDAYGLMWRLALAKRNPPSNDALLDSYTDERRTIAASMVKGTTKATKLMTTRNKLVAKVRGVVASRALGWKRVQKNFGRSIGMLNLRMDTSPIILKGAMSTHRAGMRLPNPMHEGTWLHEQLDEARHTILMLDPEGAEFAQELRDAGMICLHITAAPDTKDTEDAQTQLRNAFGGALVLVVRPDRIVGMASYTRDPGPILHYTRGVLGVTPEAL